MNTVLMLTTAGILGGIIGYKSCLSYIGKEITEKAKESNLLKTQLNIASQGIKLSFNDRLVLFDMNEYRKYHLLMSTRDKDYLVCKYLKEHEILPYTSVVGDTIYKYPKMRFVIDLDTNSFICDKKYRLDLTVDEYFRFKDFAKGTQFVLELSDGPCRKPKRDFLGKVKDDYKEVDRGLSANILVFHEDLKIRL